MAKLIRVDYRKPIKHEHSKKYEDWSQWECSNCDKILHKSAKSCTNCGASFKKRGK